MNGKFLPVKMHKTFSALILAEPGDRIILASGSFNLMHGLSLDVDNVILEGAGMDKTFLIFDQQKTCPRSFSYIG